MIEKGRSVARCPTRTRVGKLYCEFCQNKKEREIIKKIVEIESDPNDQVQVVEDKVYSEKEFDENN